KNIGQIGQAESQIPTIDHLEYLVEKELFFIVHQHHPVRRYCKCYIENGLTQECLTECLIKYPSVSSILLWLFKSKTYCPPAVRQLTLNNPHIVLSLDQVILHPKMSMLHNFKSHDVCQESLRYKNFHTCPKDIAGHRHDERWNPSFAWRAYHSTAFLKAFRIHQQSVLHLQILFHSLSNETVSQNELSVGFKVNNINCEQNNYSLSSTRFATSLVNSIEFDSKLGHNRLETNCWCFVNVYDFSAREPPKYIVTSAMDASPSLSRRWNNSVSYLLQGHVRNLLQNKGIDDSWKLKIYFKGIHLEGNEFRSVCKQINCTESAIQTYISESAFCSPEKLASAKKEMNAQSVVPKKEQFSCINIAINTKDTSDVMLNRANNPTFQSHYLQLNVQMDDIICSSVKSVCKYETRGCKKLRSRLFHHWQINEQGRHRFTFSLTFHNNLKQVCYDEPTRCVDLPCFDPKTNDYSICGLWKLLVKDNWKEISDNAILHNVPKAKMLLLRKVCAKTRKCILFRGPSYELYILDSNLRWIKCDEVSSNGKEKLACIFESEGVDKHPRCSLGRSSPFLNEKRGYISDIKTSNGRSSCPETKGCHVFHFSIPIKNPKTNIWESEFPDTWDLMSAHTRVKCISLAQTSEEFQMVVKLLGEKLSTSCVEKVERVQNPFLWRALKNKIQEMVLVYGDISKVNIRRLFHGTQREAVQSICAENFDWRLHGSRTGEMYGQGTYFSTNAAYSYEYCHSDSDGKKYMFMARVAVGTISLGKSDMKRPPINPNTGSPYDSTVDDVSDIKIIVKYDKQEYYPEYILTLT
ncbi:Poly (ADP-ribose) polymerase, partial [Halocaridina rubra]